MVRILNPWQLWIGSTGGSTGSILVGLGFLLGKIQVLGGENWDGKNVQNSRTTGKL